MVREDGLVKVLDFGVAARARLHRRNRDPPPAPALRPPGRRAAGRWNAGLHGAGAAPRPGDRRARRSIWLGGARPRAAHGALALEEGDRISRPSAARRLSRLSRFSIRSAPASLCRWTRPSSARSPPRRPTASRRWMLSSPYSPRSPPYPRPRLRLCARLLPSVRPAADSSPSLAPMGDVAAVVPPTEPPPSSARLTPPPPTSRRVPTAALWSRSSGPDLGPVVDPAARTTFASRIPTPTASRPHASALTLRPPPSTPRWISTSTSAVSPTGPRSKASSSSSSSAWPRRPACGPRCCSPPA